MGKHKKEKSHKKHKKHSSKHSKKRSHKSSDSESENEVVWSEAGAAQDPPKEDDLIGPEEPSPAQAPREDENEWSGLFSSQNTTVNVKKAEKLKFEAQKYSNANENRLRYTRELNSYFKDETTKKFIENPDDYWKSKQRPQEVVESEDEEEDEDDDRSDDEPASQEGNIYCCFWYDF